eukprot:CAMPEP_0201285704 /NCGR_PEP_ID=MMETSP1317-20130820/113712_1 /ASSEMBLY_ACC=CAM_ASM_000770 /TAXON_ID=187299 /ORGANISM="Undescribed Undescribed, Strain Undescribed" /LENGTH=51 /DNA_ID=CAMNT_0047611509 /DNA_START=1151 /DNA_END=1306 /DNA_ORIENTATION=+
MADDHFTNTVPHDYEIAGLRVVGVLEDLGRASATGTPFAFLPKEALTVGLK